MTHNKAFNPTTCQTHAQVMKNNEQAKTQNNVNREEMMALQQSHNVNSFIGDTTNCDTNEAQTLVNATCDCNGTFKMEENFTNSWQQSINTVEDTEKEFSDKTNEMFNDEE